MKWCYSGGLGFEMGNSSFNCISWSSSLVDFSSVNIFSVYIKVYKIYMIKKWQNVRYSQSLRKDHLWVDACVKVHGVWSL